MTLTQANLPIDAIVEQMRRKYPDWEGFDHPHFNRWKRVDALRACEEAAELLNRRELDRLYHAGAYDEFLLRFRRVGRILLDNPGQNAGSGDFRMLEGAAGNAPSFCTALIDLLHGTEDSSERLYRFQRYCEAMSLPAFWGFPTHFLFVSDPEHNFLVKPKMVSCFLQLIGSPLMLTKYPDAACYRNVVTLMLRLKEEMDSYGPRDMLDIFGLVSSVYDILSGNRRGVR